MTRVLVVDDEPGLRQALVINLRARDYQVVAAPDGAAALEAAAREPPDAVVLDLGLPDMDGTEVIAACADGRGCRSSCCPRGPASGDKVEALDAGADDYVTKPFGMDELLARLRAALRRAVGEEDAPVVVDAELHRRSRRQASADGEGEAVRLTPTEWRLLEILVRNEGKLVPRRQLLQEIWGPAYETETNYLRVYIAQLRRKLETDPSHPRHLITEPGMGYRFVRE